MEKHAGYRLSVVVTLFLSVFLLICSFCLQAKTANTLNELALAVEREQHTEPQATAAPVHTEEPTVLLSQLQNTEAVSESVSAKQIGNKETKRSAENTTAERNTEISQTLIVNENTKKIHSPDCSYAQNIKAENRTEISRDNLSAYTQNGYTLCGHCKGCAK